jgi:hypothetical protein
MACSSTVSPVAITGRTSAPASAGSNGSKRTLVHAMALLKVFILETAVKKC